MIREDRYGYAAKAVVDFGGGVHWVPVNSRPGPGCYPEGWDDVEDVLDRIADADVAGLLRGLIEANEDLSREVSALRSEQHSGGEGAK